MSTRLDPRRVDTSRIGDIEVVATYVDGRDRRGAGSESGEGKP
ncbi:hypothetical protein [Streptomyces coeruleorubidus]|nr:hypothetical protein [Streptomyces coeruleorubidus]